MPLTLRNFSNICCHYTLTVEIVHQLSVVTIHDYSIQSHISQALPPIMVQRKISQACFPERPCRILGPNFHWTGNWRKRNFQTPEIPPPKQKYDYSTNSPTYLPQNKVSFVKGYFFHRCSPFFSHSPSTFWRALNVLRVTGWWCQPIWKIVVKLDIFPNFRGENSKNLWNHHLGKLCKVGWLVI